MIYKTLVLTGLRANELRTLTVGQLHLDAGAEYLQLDAADEKNREGNAVPIRDDLAADLRGWLADALAAMQADARAAGRPIPTRLAGDGAGLYRADGSGADPRPGLEGGRHPEDGTTGSGRWTYTPCGRRSARS